MQQEPSWEGAQRPPGALARRRPVNKSALFQFFKKSQTTSNMTWLHRNSSFNFNTCVTAKFLSASNTESPTGPWRSLLWQSWALRRQRTGLIELVKDDLPVRTKSFSGYLKHLETYRTSKLPTLCGPSKFLRYIYIYIYSSQKPRSRSKDPALVFHN